MSLKQLNDRLSVVVLMNHSGTFRDGFQEHPSLCSMYSEAQTGDGSFG